MVKCSKCKVEKPASNFYRRVQNRSGLSSWCRECTNDSGKAWRQNDAGYATNWSKNRRETSTRKIVEYLRENPCVDCGEDDPLVLEFDHIDGKKTNVTSITARPWSRIEKEIELCQVRCCNCHRRKTMRTGLRARVMEDWPQDEKAAK